MVDFAISIHAPGSPDAIHTGNRLMGFFAHVDPYAADAADIIADRRMICGIDMTHLTKRMSPL